jgi:hypothetical protein
MRITSRKRQENAMDKQAFEIMGNIMLQVAKSQEQYEQFSGWLKMYFRDLKRIKQKMMPTN